MENDQPPPPKKKTPSDVIRTTTVQDYLSAHSKPNGGWRSFLHSNLFAALVIWMLGQAVFIGGAFISFYVRMNQLAEWKGQTDATLRRMDDNGTTYGHYNDMREDRDIIDLQTRMKKSEDEGRHWEVIETEHKRLTADVEDLRHGKK